MGRPKTFIPCYVCFKEFGSKSLTIHEPRCLERWRISNKSLPAEKRPPTPIKPADSNISQDSICPYCQISIPTTEKDEHTLICSAKKLRSNNNSPASKQRTMTGVVTSEFSPKKGKENKNHPNHIPVPSVVKKNAKNAAKVESKEKLNPIEKNGGSKNKDTTKEQQTNVQDSKTSEDIRKDGEDSSSTSKRSVRPQTKILRRPTPNLKHPVIQVDSDDSSGDSSCSDKSKDDNPKRLKIGNESSDSTHKPKNFIIYNKNNVEKNTKKEPKERTSATMVSPSIPNPCTSCNRSQAPERLHSHAKRDSRGLMYNRKSPSLDIKMASPQKKAPELPDKPKTKNKDKIAEVQQDNNKGNSVSHSASESSVAKYNTLDLKKKNTKLAIDDANATTEPYSSKKYLLDITKRCYICDEEFKVSDLLLHESQCLEVSGFFFVFTSILRYGV
ncbi:uncharacterized protein CDAR_303331 [Caerostris darwini]|uniref:Zinc finger protein n=1 Tax=Caerostris darwini TaxID=1538125 RepID=A0AAV4MZC1_9ARAC|nr:uncharacterized protein CDAR_303331 [Caerostris darwini]